MNDPQKGCRISTGQIDRLEAILLEDDQLLVSILPSRGAKIHQFKPKPSGHDFLYHNLRCRPRQPVFGVNVDNWWSGGIDEAIPTGHPCTYRGDELPYLGEVWSQAWNWKTVSNTLELVELHFSCDAIITPLRVERWVSLTAGEKSIQVRHKVTNTEFKPVDFLWGIHPAFAIPPGWRIELPAKTVWVAESSPDNHLGDRGSIYQWPFASQTDGSTVGMRLIPDPEVGWHEMRHAIEFEAGWLAVIDLTSRLGVRLTFSKDVFNTLRLWLVYSGWRDLYSAALEPWNGYPAKLTDALVDGRCSRGLQLVCRLRPRLDLSL